MSETSAPRINSYSPWQRLLRYITQAFGDTDEGFNFATGIHLGLVVAIRHPEYAVAMHRAIELEDMPDHSQSSEELADHLVSAIPVELVHTGEELEGEPR